MVCTHFAKNHSLRFYFVFAHIIVTMILLWSTDKTYAVHSDCRPKWVAERSACMQSPNEFICEIKIQITELRATSADEQKWSKCVKVKKRVAFEEECQWKTEQQKNHVRVMCHCLIIVHRIYCIFFQFWYVLSHSNWFTFHSDAAHSNTVSPEHLLLDIIFIYGMGCSLFSLFAITVVLPLWASNINCIAQLRRYWRCFRKYPQSEEGWCYYDADYASRPYLQHI